MAAADPADRPHRVAHPAPPPAHCRGVEPPAAVEHLEQAALAADVRDKLVAAARAGVPEHVRAGLGDGEQQVVNAALVDSQAGQSVPEDPPHDGYAQRFPGEDQAELDVCGRLPRMKNPRSHPLLSPVAAVSQFTL